VSVLPPGTTIHSAKLMLYPISRSNEGGVTVSAFQVLRPWAEMQATWNQARAGQAWGLPGCSQAATDLAATASAATLVSAINVWNEWDLTGLVQGWVNTPASNRGVVLKGSGLTAVEYSYATSEYWWALNLSPKLVLRYTAP
ncbi:MAG: DNRLRE domain-containing protein, partial [Chloroflexota bacterium]